MTRPMDLALLSPPLKRHISSILLNDNPQFRLEIEISLQGFMDPNALRVLEMGESVESEIRCSQKRARLSLCNPAILEVTESFSPL
jgi:hypothetical protein